MASEQAKLFSWMIENLEEGNDKEFVDLSEIKKKYNSEVTSSAVGNLVVRMFKGVKIKAGRCKEDWTKYTQRYYGLCWRQNSNVDIEFHNIPSMLPSDFFVISKSTDTIKVGYFCGEIINGSKVLVEITVESSGNWKLVVMGKTINSIKAGVQEQFQFKLKSIESFFFFF